MAGPWERYQSVEPQGQGPWAKYATPMPAIEDRTEKAQTSLEAPVADGEDPYDRSMMFPISWNKKTNQPEFAVPGLIKGLWESGKAAVTAPGRALSGELQVRGPDGHTTPEAVQEGLNMAMWSTPPTPGKLQWAPRTTATKPKPEGLAVAEAATRQGVELPKAVVSDKTSVQQIGKTVANIPVAGTPLRKASEKAIGQLDDAAKTVERGYGTGSPSSAGSMVRDDITDYASNILSERVGARYDAVDKLVQPNVVTQLSKTKQVADDILARRQNAMLPGDSKAVETIRAAASSPQGLNYEGIKDLRTSIGEMMKPQNLSSSGMSEAELKRIYGALTDDLKSAVQRGGGENALKAWEGANQFAASVAKERKALQKVLGQSQPKSDEAVFDTLYKMAGSASRADISTLAKARQAVSKESWDEMSSAVLSQMGRDADGKFSPDRFLTAYGKLSEGGKKILFSTTEKKDLAKSLDDIAMVSRRFKQLNQFANPSGTAQSIFSGGLVGGGVAAPMTTLSSVAGGRIAASLLAKPVTAKKVADWAKAYEAAVSKPSPSTKALLEQRTKALTTIIAAERGGAASLPILNNSSKAVADDGKSDPNGKENKQESKPYYIPYPA